ncbi:autotransporter domain-containing protein [Aerolutibacter ruishenii]|uniref:Outer membrane lipase/esterase n=1 Tax=Aerolutibacter ruishenii TaxID=686800 RepID=A0A562LN51_9GAMM|nr:autotransporter domain-containing protein [Lysobacter ruishenii]TWI09059.1 outer membrane lipase/esterase [Lysobacter ruishenii]
MKKIVRSALAAALALAAAPALAQTYSQTVFFGDSLTDSGFYRPFLVQQNPQAAILGRFTTNPGLVWSEYLADFYGTGAAPAWGLTTTGIVNGTGTNYAAGGARITLQPGFRPQPPTSAAPSLAMQVNAYLARNGGRADPNALYTVWGGANDLFFHINGLTTQQQFLTAAVEQIGLVGKLQGAGARYVLVPTMPDVGTTPLGLSLGAANAAGISALVGGYNQTLFGGLAQGGLRVIPLNTFALLREISASPSVYGFGNVTQAACGATSALICSPADYPAGAQESYLYADNVHPTAATHRMLAEYAVSVLEGPRQVALLPNAASMVGRARAERVAAQLDPAESDGLRWWADVRGDFQRYGKGDTYDGAGPTLTVGASWTRGDLVFGAFGGYGQQSQDWGRRGGSFDQSDASLGGFVGWKADSGLWVNAQASYSQLGFDTDRDVVLGPATRTHEGSADGSNVSIGASAGWEFGWGALRHGPVIAVLSQKIEIDAFAESDPALSTSLAYPEQSFDSLIGSVGWQFSGTIHEHLKPYARVTWDEEFEDAPAEAFAQLQSMSVTLPYAVPGHRFDQTYGTLTFGARTQLMGMDANLGTSVTVGQEGGNHATVFATMGMGF